MSMALPHEQLRLAREARQQDISGMARRTGLRPELLRAIEEGRFGDLPPGVYGRSAIRAYASELGLDGRTILSQCEPLLRSLDDPIAALARLRGLRPATAAEPVIPPLAGADLPEGVTPSSTGADPALTWRAAAAAALDAGVIGALDLFAFVATLLFCRTWPSALSPSAAPAFAVFGLLLAAWYFVYFAGIAGQTLGERIALPDTPAEPVTTDLRKIGTRAVRTALREVALLQLLGQQFGLVSRKRGAAARELASASHGRVHAITEL